MIGTGEAAAHVEPGFVNRLSLQLNQPDVDVAADELWSDDLHAAGRGQLDWLWHGYLARQLRPLLPRLATTGKMPV